MISTVLQIIQMILGILLVVLVLLQQKGAGLGAGFGGGGGPVVTTRRGVDLFLHKLTIVTSIAFFLISFGSLFV